MYIYCNIHIYVCVCVCVCVCVYIYISPLAAQHAGTQFPVQGSNPCLLQWKFRVLTTDHQGNPSFILLRDTLADFALSWVYNEHITKNKGHKTYYTLEMQWQNTKLLSKLQHFLLLYSFVKALLKSNDFLFLL